MQKRLNKSVLIIFVRSYLCILAFLSFCDGMENFLEQASSFCIGPMAHGDVFASLQVSGLHVYAGRRPKAYRKPFQRFGSY
jgi:hypothetical protein